MDKNKKRLKKWEETLKNVADEDCVIILEKEENH